MANVVITGSTKGIGRGLALEFLKRGHNVVVSSRRQADVDKAVLELAAVGTGKVSGRTCDVTRKADCQALWDHAVQAFGRVDYWINNAGRAVSRFLVHEMDEETVHSLVDGNFKGTVFGSQVAINGFRQQGGGALYNMLGGSYGPGRLTPNMGVYSATKAADWKLSQYLADEIRPMLNILCDYVETSTPWLVEQILANRKTGKRIAWLTNAKIMGRFFNAYVLGRKRDLFSRYGL
jgi:NAD(P)-dependent dehydrogenase (short-subunit alcohol dehydrogenase family)